MQYFPILIGVDYINPRYLQTEYGESAEESLSKILKMKNELDYKTFWERVRYYNFELLKPIPQPELTFYKVFYTGNTWSPDFNWSIEKI